ncbi:MAG: hypothetical protein Tsb005_15690 [Gammaproteobacteria bacterium]
MAENFIKLSALDYVYQLVDNYVVTSIEVTGQISLEALQQAVKICVQEQPLLRAQFAVRNNISGLMIVDSIKYIPCYQHCINKFSQSDAFIQQKMQTPISFHNNLLWEINLITYETDNKRHSLVITNHHAIADANSIKYLIKSIYQNIETTQSEHLLQPKSIELPSNYPNFIKYNCSVKKQGLLKLLKQLKQQVIIRIKQVNLFKLPALLQQRSRYKLTVKRECFNLSKSHTKKLIAFCKSQRITLSALMNACMIKACLLAYEASPQRLYVINAINAVCARRFAYPIIGDDCVGNFAIALDLPLFFHKDTPLLDMANNIQLQMQKELQRPKQLIWNSNINSLDAKFLRYHTQHLKQCIAPFLLSNLGNINDINCFKLFKIERLFFSGTSPYGCNIGIRISAATIAQRLNWAFTWNEEEIEKIFIQKMMKNFYDLLVETTTV